MLEENTEKNFNQIFKETMEHYEENHDSFSNISPINTKNIFDLTENNKDYISVWNKGIDMISQNKTAVLIMAGGSGTRLGSSQPKGMYVCEGLQQSLFEIHILNLKNIQKKTQTQIPLIIMTSDQTNNPTQNYFGENNYFGLDKDNILFFCQSSIPTFTLDGEFIIESENKISMSANGNGDLYFSLIKSGIYDKLIKKNIEYLQIIAVDNILSKIADPAFFGLAGNHDLAVKVISKNSDYESVGVFALLDGKLGVVEYSEIGKDLAELKNENGERVFDCANIGSHIFKLNKIKEKIELTKMYYHIAKKKIQSKDGKIDGIKLELFIFDLFKEFDSYVIAKVKREEEYSPIKNALGDNSPETAVKAYYSINKNDIYYS
jgi:UDP-N-acetylglucosamine/UDP-N-acetylgalactosamine diphosphorylase